ncbi:MAG: S26 family signal peptidase [Alphaproteobacteria bacterium]|nr:S26 family signal peptidase [Alphaproteobacteria bacterium]
MLSETDAPSQTDAPLTPWQKVVRELKEWGATLAIVAPAFLLFTGLLYEQRVIPSESMVPTLEVGDRVAVAKFAYGYGRYSLPLRL